VIRCCHLVSSIPIWAIFLCSRIILRPLFTASHQIVAKATTTIEHDTMIALSRPLDLQIEMLANSLRPYLNVHYNMRTATSDTTMDTTINPSKIAQPTHHHAHTKLAVSNHRHITTLHSMGCSPVRRIVLPSFIVHFLVLDLLFLERFFLVLHILVHLFVCSTTSTP